MKLSVISPTLNEAENVPRLVDELALALRDVDYEILIVDDNSPDRTWSVADEIAAANPRVRTLRRMQNPGLGLAVMDGFAAAEGDVVACIDADLQHDPSILSRMLQEFDKGANVVVGSRHVQGGSTGDWDRLRRLQSWLATRTAQFFLGIRLKDPMSGYFLFSRKDFDGVKEDLNGNGFKILLEILANLRPEQVKEVPYTFRSRTRGESKLTNKVILQYLQQVWRLCGSSRRFSIRLLKSAAGGGMEVLMNLAVMALLLTLTNLHNWKASALAMPGGGGNELFSAPCAGVRRRRRRGFPEPEWLSLPTADVCRGPGGDDRFLCRNLPEPGFMRRWHILPPERLFFTRECHGSSLPSCSAWDSSTP